MLINEANRLANDLWNRDECNRGVTSTAADSKTDRDAGDATEYAGPRG
jgi:hypothetical protein